MRSPASPPLVTLIVEACCVYVAHKRLCNTAGYDAVGTSTSLPIDDDDDETGVVTSPAVKLSPNARNFVRESRGDGVGPVGGCDSPHPTEIAAMTATGTKNRIKSELMISED